MSYTFDELFSLAPNYDPKTEYLIATATLTIAQEDGRCAYAHGTVYIDPNAREASVNPIVKTTDPAFGYYLFFSDRARFTGPADEIGLRLNNGAGSGFDLTVLLWQWGGGNYKVRFELPINVAALGKVYSGWGETIGHGAGQALHTLTLTDLVVRKIELV